MDSDRDEQHVRSPQRQSFPLAPLLRPIALSYVSVYISRLFTTPMCSSVDRPARQSHAALGFSGVESVVL